MSVLPQIVSLTGAAAAVSTVIWASTHSRATLWGPVCWHGSGNRVALTFDDGPTPGSTEDVLTALAAVKTKATFFVIGNHVRRFPELLKRVHDAGHLIANHTFDHPHNMFLRGTRFWREQIESTNCEIEKVIGAKPKYFRSPMGVRTWRAARPLRESGQVFVTWSLRALDGLPTTAEQICDRLIPHTKAGDILVLHDGIEPGYKRNPEATVQAIPRIVAALRSRGLEPVRLDELLESPTANATT
jgi:peptidoglycan/xylan/chitin deacetylase (PgdA/CDA1 family)